jgi:glycerol-3-phosphate dehydrogenase
MLYYDGQFDDARLAMTLALTAADHGALLVNYAKVTSLKKQKGLVTGLHVTNLETHKSHTISARVVINATGIFADHLRKLDTSRAPPMMVPSQGVHLVLGPEFLRGDTAILVPHTDDGRVIFLVPWEGKVLIGTTDTPVKKTSLEPIPLKSEVEFLLETAGRYLAKAPTENDILSLFAGLRPLVRSSSTKGTSEIARDHAITISKSGLLTIAGGKWTTYRKMAEDAVGRAIRLGHLPARPCMTETLKLHGYLAKVDPHDPLSVYGSRAKEIRSLQRKSAFLRKKIHPRLPYTYAQLRFAVREEMARTVDDLLARRTRALLLDAAAAIESAPPVAAFLRRELKQSRRWMEQQIREFQRLAENYLYL